MVGNAYEILLAEDNPGDVQLVREALETHDLAVNFHVVTDGEQALRFIRAVDANEAIPLLQLVLLDLNLPRISGEELLAHLRQSPRCRHIPVVAISSAPPRGVAPVIHYFRKPNDYDEYMLLGGFVKGVLQSSAAAGLDEPRTLQNTLKAGAGDYV
jgi:CheY-like chemotaxis protein